MVVCLLLAGEASPTKEDSGCDDALPSGIDKKKILRVAFNLIF